MKRILASHGRRNRVLWESITCVTTSGEGEKHCQIGNGRLSRPTDGSSLRERPVLGTCGPQTSLECAPHPATGAVRELVRRPVVLVELERDHFRGVIPGDGLQAHRGAIGPSGDGLEK